MNEKIVMYTITIALLQFNLNSLFDNLLGNRNCTQISTFLQNCNFIARCFNTEGNLLTVFNTIKDEDLKIIRNK